MTRGLDGGEDLYAHAGSAELRIRPYARLGIQVQDNRVIIWNFLFVDGLHERRGGCMILHFGEDHLHGGKVSELIDFRSPS